jgi:hypothetical protein
MCMRDVRCAVELEVGQDIEVELSVQLLQLDNGNVYSPYPVLLAPVPSASPQPFIQLKVIKSLRDYSLNSFPLVSLLVQEANVALDDVVISSVAHFVTATLDVENYTRLGSTASSASHLSLDSVRPSSLDRGTPLSTRSLSRADERTMDPDIARMIAGSMEFEEAGVLGVELQVGGNC